MAEKTTKHTVRNKTKAVRGLFDATAALVNLEPGQTATEVELTAAGLKNVKATDYFEIDDEAESGAAADEAAGDETAPLPTKKVDLLKLAKAEGVDVDAIKGTGKSGNVVTQDIADAITANREAKAAPAAGGIPEINPGVGDDLDRMSDDDLRATVQAITGEQPPADADRPALLKLARGEE